MYSYEQGILIAQRLAIWTALVVIMVVYDETSPFELVGIRGPSMIPTMAADGSDLWFCRKYPTWLRQLYDTTTSTVLLSLIQPRLRHGSIVGFTHPDCPNSAIAMKRIVGLPGDRVQRYGQFVHLYTHQDPVGWGITWPTIYDSNHIWIKNLGTAWDVDKTESITNPSVEVMRTLVVPDGHVWIEADCPALGLDSRHFGPIPISWIRTRVISKVWPLQVSPLYPRWYHRPHPIPLDAETLMEYNVFYDTINNKPSTWQV
jgi:signal peptidase I